MNENKRVEIVKADYNELRKLLWDYGKNVKGLLPNGVQYSRLLATAYDAVRRDKSLLATLKTEKGCNSLINSVLHSARFGIYPDGVMAAIVPRKIGKDKIVCATFMPMWKGLLFLGYRAGAIKAARRDVVYKGEKFIHRGGINYELIHEPDPSKRDGKNIVAAWFVAELSTGGVVFEVVYKDNIDRAMASAAGTDKPDSAWNKFKSEMWSKTAVKRGMAMIPYADDLRYAIAVDDQAEAGHEQTAGLIIDIPPEGDDTPRVTAPSSSELAGQLKAAQRDADPKLPPEDTAAVEAEQARVEARRNGQDQSNGDLFNDVPPPPPDEAYKDDDEGF